MHFTRDHDREAIAHLVAELAELEDGIRERYLPAAQRLSARPDRVPRPLADALAFAINVGPGYEGSIASIRACADSLITGSSPGEAKATIGDALAHLKVATAKYLALLDYTRPRITRLEWTSSDTKRRLVRNVDIATHTRPYQHGTPASIYFLLGQVIQP